MVYRRAKTAWIIYLGVRECVLSPARAFLSSSSSPSPLLLFLVPNLFLNLRNVYRNTYIVPSLGVRMCLFVYVQSLISCFLHTASSLLTLRLLLSLWGLVEDVLVSFEKDEENELPHTTPSIRHRPCMLVGKMLASCRGALPSEFSSCIPLPCATPV